MNGQGKGVAERTKHAPLLHHLELLLYLSQSADWKLTFYVTVIIRNKIICWGGGAKNG